MRLVVLTMCALVAAGVFATMFVSVWSSHSDPSRLQTLAQSLASELVWVAIPCLMMLAAAIPAVIALLSPTTGH